jgi:hypothetical protein
MAAPYHHTQRGTVILAATLAAAVVCASISYLEPMSSQRWMSLTLAVGLVFLAWVFSSLTVDVNERELCWRFGPGLWRYRLARAEIESVQIVRNKWWNGFGIRMRPGFRLYNVSGLSAIELRLKTGDIRRIGTDDAQGLVAALTS